MDKKIIWSRMNLKEVTPELPYPLTQSTFAHSNRVVFIEQYKKMGYSLPEDTEIIKVFYGRLYFNTNILLKITSDFGSEPELLKMTLGGFQPDLIEGIDYKPSLFRRINMLPAYLKTMLLLNNIDSISEEAFCSTREKYEKDSNRDLRNLSDKELLDYFDSLEDLIKNDLTIIVGAGASVYYWYLRGFLKNLLPVGELENAINQLVTGSEGIITANQNLALMRLAGEAKKDRIVLEALDGEIGLCYDKLECTGFKKMLDEFLREFGHRGLYETSIESPRYSEDLAQVLKIIKNYVTAGMTSPNEIISRQKVAREDAVAKILKRIQESKFSYFKKKLFQSRLENYQRFLALREKNRYHCAMIVALSRKGELEVGRRAEERGILEKQHDIFFLTIYEVRSILTGKTDDFKKIVNERKVEREKNSRIKAPDVITGDAVPVEEPIRETKKIFTGYAASPGAVRGRARVIHSPEEFGKFKPGEILVASTTDPMWSTLFPVAKAVVTEMGGILSHAAIVAREYGTPCVVNVEGIMDVLEDGYLIEVDGDKGMIRIMEESIDARAANK
jgi:pyruvate,water dikinase